MSIYVFANIIYPHCVCVHIYIYMHTHTYIYTNKDLLYICIYNVSNEGLLYWRRAWQPTPAFLPGEAHGQRSLVGYSPWGRKGLDMTETT